MIQNETILQVCDNSGAKLVKCIKILCSTKKKYAHIGDIIKVSVKKVISSNKIKKGEVFYAIVIRTIYRYKRFDNSFISFKENSSILLNNKYEFIFTRIIGPVVKELKKNKFIGNKLNTLSNLII